MDLKTTEGWVNRAWRGYRWPIAPVTLVTSGDEAALQRFAGKWLSGAPELGVNDPLYLPGAAPLVARRRRAWLRRQLNELGGVFVVGDEEVTVYQDLTDPRYAKHLVRAVLEINLDDPQAVTDLVSTYGCLGLGSDLYGGGLYRIAKAFQLDPAALILGKTKIRGKLPATVRVLRDFRDHVEWLRRLQLQRARERDWSAFAASLEPRIKGMDPTIRWDRDAGAQPCWKVTSPLGLLWATLWDWATRGGEMRRCRRCHVLFFAGDSRQEFCSRTCTNRASAAAWYRKKGRARRRAARRSRER